MSTQVTQVADPQLANQWTSVMMNNYGTPAISLIRGSGARVWDAQGNEYVDLVAGIAVNALGHAHPAITSAVAQQLQTLGHTSNLYAHPTGLALAQKLVELTSDDARVFFCNSGAEANEAAVKLSRLSGRTRIVALKGGFHGRTIGALSVTGQPAKYQPFQPLLEDVVFIEPNNVAELTKAMNSKTAALWLEPILGEGGVLPLTQEFVQAASDLCRKHDSLFVVDEVQTGIGRTGSWFAYQDLGIKPDLLLLAKGLAGGLPIGAVVAFGAAANLFTPGSHGSTFGGNPISCAAALAVLEVIERDGLEIRAIELEQLLRGELESLPCVDHVRGRGLMLGVVLTSDNAKELELELRDAGVLVNAVAANVLRLVPPLVITDADISFALSAFRKVLS